MVVGEDNGALLGGEGHQWSSWDRDHPATISGG
jgi:hypothetical protein